MKPSSAEAAGRGARPPDGMQEKPETTRSSLKSVRKDAGKAEKLKYKPLTGKVFYLDIPSNVISEKIGKDLRELGGRVESFLSKDISYLVSNKKEAKFAPALGQLSPVPSPESAPNGGNSSPQPSSRKEVHMSRGKSLVEKAIKEQDLIPSGSVLSSALSWGVKILHLDDIKNYIEQKKKELYLMKRADSAFRDGGKQATAQRTRSKLKHPFVKVEDSSRQYRPFYLQFPSFPELNYCLPKPYSPFEVEKKQPSGPKQAHSKQRNKLNGDQDCATAAHLPQKDKKKRGYCECCGKKYEDLQTHLDSDQHQRFAQSTQYQVVDEIMSKLVYEFVAYKDDTKPIKRPKCSTGSCSPLLGKVSRPEELQERLRKQRLCLRACWWKEAAGRALQPQRLPAELQPNSLPLPPPLPASACSLLHCHLPPPSEGRSKLSNNDENIQTGLSCAARSAAAVGSAQVTPLPPQKEEKASPEAFSQPFEPCSREILEPEVNKPSVECFQEGFSTSYSPPRAADVSERDRSLSQPKRKLHHAGLLPAKCLRRTDASPASVKKHSDSRDNHQQMQPSVLLEAEVADPAANRELGESAASPAQASPSGKLHRKVKLYLGRTKREARKQSMELGVKCADGLSGPEEKRSCCSSPVQALLELFQTSEGSSEFGGFSGGTEDRSSSSMKDSWERQNANATWSSLSSSSSSFVGF